MTKARTLADFISDGSEFADGTISVSEVSGAAPTASPTFTGNVGMGVSPTTSYGKVLQIHDTGTAGANLRLTDATSSSGTNNGMEIIQIGVESYVINREAGAMSFYTNQNKRMQIESGGSVVINDISADADFRVESDNVSNMLHVDAGNNRLNIGGSPNSYSANRVNIYGDNVNPPAAANGNLAVYAVDSQAAGNGGSISLGGRYTDAGAFYQFGAIQAVKKNSTSGNSAGLFKLYYVNSANGTNPFLEASEDEIVFNNAGLDDDFRVESDNNANMLLVDASTDNVVIGNSGANNTGGLFQVGSNLSGSVFSGSTALIANPTTMSSSSGSSYKILQLAQNTGNSTALTFRGVRQSTGSDWTSSRFEVSLDVDNTNNIYRYLGFEVGRLAVNPANQTGTDFVVRSANEDHMLFVDAAENAVGFGDSAPRDSSWGTASASRQVSIQGPDYGVLHIKATAGTGTRWAMGAGDSGRLYAAYDDINAKHNLTYYGAGPVFNPDGNSDIDFVVESDTNTHMLFVDAGANKIGINNNSPDSMVTIKNTSTNMRSLRVYSSGSAAVIDLGVGTGQTNGNDAYLALRNQNAADVITLSTDGVTVFNENGDATNDFRVESNGQANMLFIDGGSDTVNIAQSTGSTLGGDIRTRLYVNGAINAGALRTRGMANPNGKVFTFPVGTNGSASFLELTCTDYLGARKTIFTCNNASGNWNVVARDVMSSGTAPTFTISGSGTAQPTITVSCNTSYSGGFLKIDQMGAIPTVA